MGGPAVSILMPSVFNDKERGKLQQAVASISDPTITGEEFDFWVTTTKPIGGQYLAVKKAQCRPFALEVMPIAVKLPSDDTDALLRTAYYDEQSILEIQSVFGFRPIAAVEIVAYCNGDEDHRILGELANYVCRAFRGIVDFGGQLYGRGLGATEMDQVKASLPGVWAYLSYAIDEGKRGKTDCGDETFMDAWLNHSAFRMIK